MGTVCGSPNLAWVLQQRLRALRAAALAAAVFLAPCLATAQSVNAIPSAATYGGRSSIALTAAEIVERNAAARGGLEAWHAVQNLTEFGHLAGARVGAQAVPTAAGRAQGMAPRENVVPFTMYLKRPHKRRLEIQYQGVTAVQLFDGKQGWTVLPSAHGPVAKPFPPGAAQAAAMQQDLDGPLIDSAAKGTRVELEESDMVDGRPTYRLKLTLSNGDVRHLWVDSETFRDTKIDGTRMLNGKIWTVETYFSDYKHVKGLWIPGTLDTAVEGVRSTQRIVIDRFVVNSPLDDGMFSVPAPERAP
jgi:outer membrane lipoprotein-sorting protein